MARKQIAWSRRPGTSAPLIFGATSTRQHAALLGLQVEQRLAFETGISRFGALQVKPAAFGHAQAW